MRRNPDNPSTMFFWNDWDNEPGMKFCGLAAQGLWVKMLSLAARSREYGVVLIGDHPSLREDLPSLLASSCGGETVETIDKLIADLITFKVASVDDRGRVINRRMVAEAKLSAARSEAGRKGADVANLARQSSGKGVGKQVSKAGGKQVGKTRSRKSPASAGQQRELSTEPPNPIRQNDGNGSGKTAPSSFFTLSSVSKDTGADAPIDKRKVTFSACLAYLKQTVPDDSQPGSFWANGAATMATMPCMPQSTRRRSALRVIRFPTSRPASAPSGAQRHASTVGRLNHVRLSQTDRHAGQNFPDLLNAHASQARLELASKAGALTLGVDIAETIKARNSLERMLAQQLGTLHMLAMMSAASAHQMLRQQTAFGNQAQSIEAARHATAAARLMGVFQSGYVALDRVRRGGRQVVRVTHLHQQVAVAKGGKAVVAGSVKTGGPRKRGAARGEGSRNAV